MFSFIRDFHFGLLGEREYTPEPPFLILRVWIFSTGSRLRFHQTPASPCAQNAKTAWSEQYEIYRLCGNASIILVFPDAKSTAFQKHSRNAQHLGSGHAIDRTAAVSRGDTVSILRRYVNSGRGRQVPSAACNHLTVSRNRRRGAHVRLLIPPGWRTRNMRLGVHRRIRPEKRPSRKVGRLHFETGPDSCRPWHH